MNTTCLGGSCRFPRGKTFAVMLLAAGFIAAGQVRAQETPAKSPATPAAPSTGTTTSTPSVSAPAPKSAPVQSRFGARSDRSGATTKRSLAPRPPGATPPALAADPAAAAAALAKSEPTPSGDGSPGSEPLVLPNVTITETAPVVPKSEDVLDAKARLEKALKANPGLRIGGPLAKLNHGIALAMQQEAKEAAARAAMIEHVENLPAMDEERAKEEVRLMREATARPNNDWRGRR